jgi:hypothetical protein
MTDVAQRLVQRSTELALEGREVLGRHLFLLRAVLAHRAELAPVVARVARRWSSLLRGFADRFGEIARDANYMECRAAGTRSALAGAVTVAAALPRVLDLLDRSHADVALDGDDYPKAVFGEAAHRAGGRDTPLGDALIGWTFRVWAQMEDRQ